MRERPENALRFDGKQKHGNIIALLDGTQDPRDSHSNFETRIKNYVLGKNPLVLQSEREVELGRERSVGILAGLFDKQGSRVNEVMGRGRKLSTSQVDRLIRALDDIKREARA